MNLYPSDSLFEVGGHSYHGFPILVDSHGKIVEIALLFFVHELIGRAGARDPKTWEAYGRHLYDYFGYLEAKQLCWNRIPGMMSGDVSPLAHYVHWCDAVVGNDPGYINDKVGTIIRFYRWAHRSGLIDELPFSDTETTSAHVGGILKHTSGSRAKRETTDLRLNDPEKPLKVLSRRQIDVVLKSISNPTHRAIVHLGLNSGLRAEELTSFPAQYVVDCRKISDKVKTIAVRLNAHDMDIKNDKVRTVRVSVPCMNLLWQYRETVRPALETVGKSASKKLFLTRYGKPFVSDGLVAPLARLGVRLGFHIHPHMLRHTFATHTLASLEDLKKNGRLKSSPLVILKGLLGHSSISTTNRYLHFLDTIEDTYGTQYQSEIDTLVREYLGERVKRT